MGGELTLEQIKAALAAQQANPKPWDAPMAPTPSPVPTPAATPPPTAPPPANPANQDALMQAQKLMRMRGQLAPLGTEQGIVGGDPSGGGISAQDATLDAVDGTV